jgi:replicative DNA helicase
VNSTNDIASAAFDRIPPHSIDAEVCLLGAMMLDAEFSRAAASQIAPRAFYLSDHQTIFAALADLTNRRRPVDGVTLKAELTRLGLLDQVGGAAYIGKILTTIPSAAHGPEYLDIVRKLAGRRALIALADTITREAYAGDQDFAEISERAMKQAMRIAARGAAERVVTASQVVDEFKATMTAQSMPLVGTGLEYLHPEDGDVREIMLPVGGMTVIGARPNTGKSATLKVIAQNIARRGVHVGIIAIEERRTKIVGNLASSITGIDNEVIYRRAWSESQESQISDALRDVAGLPVTFSDQSYLLKDVVSDMIAMCVNHGAKVIGIDHIHRIKDPVLGGGNRTEEIKRITTALTMIAKQYNVAVIALAQLNRAENDTGRPTPRNIRDGGSIEEDADVVILLHSEDVSKRHDSQHQKTGVLEFLVEKQRDGPAMIVCFTFDPRTLTLKPDFQSGSY